MITLAATALLLGLLSSVHCIGMCGPLALAVPSPRNTVAARVTSALLLNAGRVTTYALLGAAFGTFGRGLQLAGLQRTVSIGLGVIILAWLLAPRLLRWVNVSQGPARLVIRAQGLMARQLRRTSPEGLFVSGLLNGLLPCGMVYLALAGAIAQDGWHFGALFMVFFGLGTWPALVGLKVTSSFVGPSFRASLRKAAPVAYALMAVLFILRGLDLGLPYISPDLPEANSTLEACHTAERP
ncbi:MAG: sulfite exporter TauE/SafE family protein [Flavobacteriales bacterium]|jgi:sulfite exporter TauE/SafE|nr:sulfite exporter TauE/SafE family protein [Flavobacteriales bacterium]